MAEGSTGSREVQDQEFRRTAPRTEETRPPFPLRMWHWTTARVLYTTGIFVLICYVFRAAHDTITLFLFAILFAYFVAPLVRRMERPLRSRAAAILVTYVILAGVLTVGGFLIGPKIARETRDLASTLPELLNRAATGQLVRDFGVQHHWPLARISQLQGFIASHRKTITDFGTAIAQKLASPISHIWWLVLIPILGMFFLKQGESLAANLSSIASDSDDRVLIDGLVADVNVMLGSYIRAQIILAALTLVVYTAVLSLMRVPYAIILGPLAGFLEFIPVVGPAVGAAAIVVIAALAGYGHVVLLVLILAAWRLCQDYVNAPRIMGKSLEINPLMQIFAVLAGGEMAGVLGALISVPVAATLRIIWRRMHENAPKEVSPSGEVYTGPVTRAG